MNAERSDMTAAGFSGEFVCPSAAFRGKAFWALNGRLEEDELRRQIRVFKEMGLGGFFMHSRLGLNTAYLSEEWFDLVRSCIDEAKECGIEAWIYDEDRYPSGAAGGIVTRDPKYRRRMLKISRTARDSFSWPTDPSQFYTFAATLEDDRITWYERLGGPDGLDDLPCGAEIITFQHCLMPNMSWYNGFAYLDTMNPEAVAKFITVTHEAYRREVAEHFGKTVPGIFTDEPNPGPVFRQWFPDDGGEVCISWTGAFPQRFMEMFGYDLTDHLPEIAFDSADEPLPHRRYHYYICRTRLFVEAFSRQIGEWCEQNNLLLTGHVLEEEPSSHSVSTCGTAMRFYPFMQAPGFDVLGQYDHAYMTAKQCSSVARQMGRKWVLTELYAGTGWETTFETYRHVGDWQTVLGATMRCLHLSFYSMAGEAKRDYPPSIHYHCPWWRQFRYVEDYFSRLHVMLTAGVCVCDLVVIHPLESYYLIHNMKWQENETVKQMDDDYRQIVRRLLGGHLDFDFADEHLLVEFSATTGQDDDGAYLQVGEMTYRAVLVPPLLTMRRTTLRLLQEFAEAGGQVVFTGQAPCLVDAEPSVDATEFARGKTAPLEEQNIVELLQGIVRRVSICDSEDKQVSDIFYQLRRIGDDLVLFVVNTNRNRAFHALDVTIQTSSTDTRQLQLWDAAAGNRYDLPGAIDKQNVRFNLDLQPGGSALVVATVEREALAPWQETPKTVKKIQLDQAQWEYDLDDYNVLVLDRADCLADGRGPKPFKGEQMEILCLDRQLREHFDIDRRGGWMVQPWASQSKPIGPSVEIVLTYQIYIEAVPESPVLLALEQPDRWRIQLNGGPVDSGNVSGFWIDPAIKTLPVYTELLHTGENLLTFNGCFDRLANLEIVYLLGEFASSVNGSHAEITELRGHLELGSWIHQGLPFYGGNVTYRSEFEFARDSGRRYLLDIPGFAATVVEVRLNGNAPVIVGMANQQQEITPYLRNGKNTIEIKLFGSRRNAFGPLHIAEDAPAIVGPFTFQRDVENWQEDYKLVEYGLFEPLVILEAPQ